ncbi:MAG: hypothetical protein ACK4RK_05895 [Gemmataceae bacterium]
MSHDIIRAWLKLPTNDWPPDHYTLLDLSPEEADAHRIEQAVQERMDIVRRYQLLHPDQVTEAMNRLAQALICLTDPKARAKYDSTLRKKPKVAVLVNNGAAARNEPDSTPRTAVRSTKPTTKGQKGTNGTPAPPPSTTAGEALDDDPHRWLYGPWPRHDLAAAVPPFPDGATVLDWEEAPPPERSSEIPVGIIVSSSRPRTSPEFPEVVDAIPALQGEIDAAQSSTVARHGLTTRRALYRRIAITRQLLYAWNQLGIYLKDSQRKLSRRLEGQDVIRQLNIVRRQLHDFPPLLGQAGQPGYLVVALARQPYILQTFRSLSSHQREALARDWQAGQSLLLAHRQFLRAELRAARSKTLGGRMVRAAKELILDHSGIGLFVLGLVAVNLACRTPTALCIGQALLILIVAYVFLLVRSHLPGKDWLRRSSLPAAEPTAQTISRTAAR